MNEITKALIENLKTQPLVLALLIFNILFVGAVLYIGNEQREQMNHFAELVYGCSPVSRTLQQ
jgi:hypothetical protein